MTTIGCDNQSTQQRKRRDFTDTHWEKCKENQETKTATRREARCFKLILSIIVLDIAEGKAITTINEWSSQQQDQINIYENLLDDIEYFSEKQLKVEEEKARQKEEQLEKQTGRKINDTRIWVRGEKNEASNRRTTKSEAP